MQKSSSLIRSVSHKQRPFYLKRPHSLIIIFHIHKDSAVRALNVNDLYYIRAENKTKQKLIIVFKFQLNLTHHFILTNFNLYFNAQICYFYVLKKKVNLNLRVMHTISDIQYSVEMKLIN